MKQLKKNLLALSAALGLALTLISAAPLATGNDGRPLKIRYVEFKKCIESSKLGVAEKANFDAMKKKMETNMEGKQKELNSIVTKLNDPDYLDSLSPEAETDLKRKFRALSQEMAELENQSYQILNQTNFKVVQKLTEMVTTASKAIASRDKIDLILNEESSFYQSADLDITNAVVAEMDKMYQEEQKTGTNG